MPTDKNVYLTQTCPEESLSLGVTEGSRPFATSPRNSQSHLLTDFMVRTTVKIEQKGKGEVPGGDCVWPLETQTHSTNTILRSNQGRDT